MSHNNDSSLSSFLLGAILGALAGGAAAMLLTPQTGAETRSQIKKGAQSARVRANLAMKEGRDLAEEAEDKVGELKEDARHIAHEARKRMDRDEA